MNWFKTITSNFERNFWKMHFDIFMTKFVKAMKKEVGEGDEPWRESLGENRDLDLYLEAFDHWLNEVPSNLKTISGELVPDFKREVSQYALDKYGFNPFEKDEDSPTPEELREQWGHFASSKKKKIAQVSNKLNLNSLLRIEQDLSSNRDSDPNQEYLFGGPEFGELRAYRNINPKIFKSLIEIFKGMFLLPEKFMGKNVDSDDYDENFLADYIENDAMYIVQGESPTQTIDYIDENISDIFDDVQESVQSYLEESKDEIFSALELITNKVDGLEEKLNEESLENGDLAKFLVEYIENNNGWEKIYRRVNTVNHRSISLYDHIFDSISEDKVIDWYIENNREELFQQAAESKAENDISEFNYSDKRLSATINLTIPQKGNNELHQYDAFNGPIDYLQNIEDWDESDWENWGEISLEEWGEIADTLSEAYGIKGTYETINHIYAHILMIQDVCSSDPGLKILFSNDVSKVEISEHHEESANQLLQTNDYLNYEPARLEDIAQSREQRRIEKERERIQKKQDEEMIKKQFPQSYQQYSKEDLQKIKEKGISKKPFQAKYKFEFGSFPGSGIYTDLLRRGDIYPFTLTIYPPKTSIPDDLYSHNSSETKGMMYHTVSPPQDSTPGFGWVGGFLGKNTMWIGEVQSDVMQRTVYMRDPKKVDEFNKQEIANLQKQIETLKLQSSTEALTAKVQALQQKLQTLQVGSPEHNGVNKQIQVLQEKINSNFVDPKIMTYQQQIDKIMATPAKEPVDAFSAKPQFHDYKSKVENYFQDWIEIFFNTIMRMAKQANVKTVYIVSSESLMQKWRNYTYPETVVLFSKVYDRMAKFYGATEANAGWYTVKLELLDEKKIASNWFKIIKK